MTSVSGVVAQAWGMRRFQLRSDDQWSLIEDLLPVRTGKKGGPFRDVRQMVEEITYRYRCGIAWHDVPEVFGLGSNDTNPGIEPPDPGIGRSRGGLNTKIHQLVDGAGLPLVILVGAGQAGDRPVFEHLVNHLKIDRDGGGKPGLDCTGCAPTRRISHDTTARCCDSDASVRRSPKTTRAANAVKRRFWDVQRWRGLANRYDKPAVVYRGTAVLNAIAALDSPIVRCALGRTPTTTVPHRHPLVVGASGNYELLNGLRSPNPRSYRRRGTARRTFADAQPYRASRPPALCSRPLRLAVGASPARSRSWSYWLELLRGSCTKRGTSLSRSRPDPARIRSCSGLL